MTWSRSVFQFILVTIFGLLVAGCVPATPEDLPAVDPLVMTVAPTQTADATAGPDLVAGATQVPDTVTPTPSPTPVPTATPLIKGIYAVVPGDTLIGIALEHDVTVEEILEVNTLLNPDLLSIGQEIRIPGALEATVNLGPAADGPDTLIVCPETSRVYTLNLPLEAMQLHAFGDSLFLVAGGRLYRLLLEELGRTAVITPTDLTPPGNRVEDIAIQELVYLTQDTETDDLYLLDKSNDIYRYDIAAGQWHVAVKAGRLPGVFPDPQYLALAAHDGDIYVLDADLARIWFMREDGETPTPYFQGSEIGTSVDFAMAASSAGERFHVLTRAGALLSLEIRPGPDGVGRPDVPALAWPAQLHAQGDFLLFVDGDARSVTVRDASTYAAVRTLLFRMPAMPRLRNAALVGSTVIAIAGPYLYATSFASLTAPCPQVAFDDRPLFHGVDVTTILARIELPFDDAELPTRPRSYPGARRLYRHGVHEGLDLYALDVPGLTVGTPVGVIADGTVLRADHDYVEFTPAEYEAAEAQTRLEHRTNDELSNAFLGRQVRVEHTDTVTSVYAHLAAVAPAITPGRDIIMRATVGDVGVSGTSSGAFGNSDGVHLHFEIWVDGRYLGQGLSIDETMRLWEALFADQ